MSQADEPVPESPSEQRVIDDVRRYGWHVVLIPERDGTPGWAFTVGMAKTFGTPELIVVGLNPKVAHSVLNEIGDRIRQGEVFRVGALINGLLEGVTCTVRPVARKWFEWFVGYAQWYHRGRPFDLWQVMWPDHAGHFPWEPGFSPEWLSLEPLLEFEDEGQARCGAILKSMAPKNGESA